MTPNPLPTGAVAGTGRETSELPDREGSMSNNSTPERRRRVLARPRARERTRRDAVFAMVFVVFSLFFLWTIATSGARSAFSGDPSDYYGELTTGFLHGELSIPTPAPAALSALPDPYSPLQNGPWQQSFHDLALYHGHFYLDWGPTPVLTLYHPWRLVGLGNIPESWALWIFSAAGLGFSLLTLRTLVATYAPRARTWRVALGAIALAMGSVVPFIDRTPDIYEVAVGCAYCFLALGLYLLASGGLGARRSNWRLAVGSLALGLAAGARWDLLLATLLLAPLGIWLVRRDRLNSWGARLRLGGIVFGPAALVVAGLLAYNVARFGSPLEVGTSYQLAGFDPTKTPYYLIGYLWPNLYYYLVAPIRFTLAFPYFALPPPPAYPGGVPASYSPEVIGGIFTTTPILLALFAAPFVARRRVAKDWRVVAVTLMLCAFTIIALIALGVPGGSMRYEVDFVTLLLLPAIMTWLLSEPARRWSRRLIGAVGAVLIGFGCVVAFGISLAGYHRQIFATAPSQVHVLEDATQPLADLVTRILGHPVVVDAGCDAGLTTTPRYSTLGVGDITYAVISEGTCTLQVLSPGRGTWTLSMNLGPAPGRTLPPGSRISLQITDASGAHRYDYSGSAGSVSFPVHLAAGTNHLTLRAVAPSLPHLAIDEGLLSASEMSVAGPQR